MYKKIKLNNLYEFVKKIQPRDVSRLYNYKKRLNLFKSSLLYFVIYWLFVIAHHHNMLLFQVCKLINQNIALTINQANPIITNPIAAFLSILSQFSYHLLSLPDVSIWNHAYRHITNATVASIAKIQLIVALMVSNRADSCFFSVHITPTHGTYALHQNPVHLSWAIAIEGNMATLGSQIYNIHKNRSKNFFIFL